MKRFLGVLSIVGIIGISATLTGCQSCEVVEPGHVGILVKLDGSQKGVQDYPVQVGRVYYSSYSERLYIYPTFMQNYVWTANKAEGKAEDESMTFNSMEGASFTGDVSISYAFIPEKVPHFFVEYKMGPDHIQDVLMRSLVRNELNAEAAAMKTMEVFAKKHVIMDNVKKTLNDKLNPKGIRVDSLGFVGSIHPDPKVTEAINLVIAASQNALQAEQRIRQSKAEADQKIETARGEAESTMLKAKADSDSILLRAKSQAEANKLQAMSLNANLIQWNALQKWDGRLPQMTGGGALPFIQFTPEKADK